MAIKIIILLCAVALAIAIPVEYQQYQHNDGRDHSDEHSAPAEYQYQYGVKDYHTGDVKEHHESRKGDHVEGKYELVEPDGHKRVVQYTSDKHVGFNAVVHREPTDIKVPVPSVQNHHQLYDHQQQQHQHNYQQQEPIHQQVYTSHQQHQHQLPQLATVSHVAPAYTQHDLNGGGLSKYQTQDAIVVQTKPLEPAPIYQNQHEHAANGNSHSHVSFHNAHIQYRY